tara:strand:+ start:236 stop:3388 length:3153 start_codon:yes stop_codon:yes gene_type:complete
MSTSIRRPGVEIEQEFVTSSPTISSPTLVPCIIGPCFRVISALDDDGEPQSEAYAGTYQDGYGTVAYDLPSLGDEDSLSGLSDEIRVFLALGSDVTELNAESDEEAIASATNDAGEGYDYSAGTFTDSNATFLQSGVEEGDVLRLTWRGAEYDLKVSADASSDTTLTITAGDIDEDIFEGDYEIIRNPAEFVFDAESQASHTFGSEDDNLTLTARATDDDDEATDYVGSAGDDLTIVIAETEEISSGTAYIGDTIFDAASATFETSIGDTGEPSTDHHVSVGGEGVGQALRQILYVMSDTRALIETGEGTVSGEDWLYGSEVVTGSAGVYDQTGGAHEKVLTDASATFLSDIPNGGAGSAPTTDSYIEITGNGVYKIATIESETEITLDATTNPGGDVSSSSWVVIEEVETGAGDGETGDDHVLVDPTATFSTDGVSTSHTADLDSGGDYVSVSSVDSETQLTMSSSMTDEAAVAYEIVDTTAALTITWDSGDEEVTLTLARVAGESKSTYEEVKDALTDDEDDSYNATVSAFLTAALDGDTADGSTEFTDADVGSYALDGGADDDQLILDEDLIGSTTPVGKVYVSYRSLRLDVSESAEDASLGEWENTTDSQDALGDATTDNPLSLGVYFALLNAPSQAVSGLGVSEISSTKPNGTLDAYAGALEFLEGQEVYALVPLTQDPAVHQIFQTHVDSMSESENKGERILLFNQAFPSYATAETVASGTAGNTETVVGEEEGSFTTSVNLSEAGVEAGDYLVVSSLATADESPDAVNGTQALYGAEITEVDSGDDFALTIDFTDRTEEDDGADFSWDSDDWDDLVDVTWAVYRAGDAITAKSDQRDAIAEIGEGFANRRCFHIWPSKVVGDVDGSSSVLEGFYLASAVAGWIAEKSPAAGMTNSTVSGFTGLKYSNNYFSSSQLDRMAGGGTMIFVQESTNAALKCRHQLATDVSTVQKRELSITKAVDYVAKFFRSALSSQIGKFNITQSFLDSLSVQVQGLGRYLVSTKILNDFSVVSIGVNADDPSQVDIVCLLDVQHPCNTIYMTLQV